MNLGVIQFVELGEQEEHNDVPALSVALGWQDHEIV